MPEDVFVCVRAWVATDPPAGCCGFEPVVLFHPLPCLLSFNEHTASLGIIVVLPAFYLHSKKDRKLPPPPPPQWHLDWHVSCVLPKGRCCLLPILVSSEWTACVLWRILCHDLWTGAVHLDSEDEAMDVNVSVCAEVRFSHLDFYVCLVTVLIFSEEDFLAW